MACASTTNFVVMINGYPSKFFKASRSIRQGFPLSPYLFVLVIEGLGRLIFNAKSMGLIEGVKVTKKSILTLFLFVDCVLIFGVASLDEWRNIKALLMEYCQASRMKISEDKSVIMRLRDDDDLSKEIVALFNFKLKDMNKWMKYLGYFIKPDDYRVVDWRWLIQKIEKRINNWSFRWLSMGGRLTLVKSLLEGILVYLLSLAHIPSSILKTLRKRMFSFLWFGNVGKEKYHLVRWEALSKPKHLGGWGLKNISIFGKALVSKSLWRGLFGSSMRCSLIKEKYIKKFLVIDWIRWSSKLVKGVSNTLKALVKSFSVIGDWRAWKVGMENFRGEFSPMGKI